MKRQPSKTAKHKKRKVIRKPFMGTPPEVMDIKTLAQYIGMGRSKIYNLIRQRKIPASRIGRQYRFSKPLIEQWLREQLITRPEESQYSLFKNR